MADENVNPYSEEPVVPAAPEMPAEPPAAPEMSVEEPAAFEEPVPAPEMPAASAPMPPTPPAPPAPAYAPPAAPAPSYQAPVAGATDKNKIVAGILGILLGALGIHKFYLGYMKEGIIMLAISIVSFGMLAWATSIVGLIEGIIYLTKSDEEFFGIYVAGRKPWF